MAAKPIPVQQQVEALERKNKLLTDGLHQAEKLRQLWADAVEELKVARSELNTSRRFLDQVLAVEPDIILVVDEHGRIVLANLATARLTGISRKNLVGRNLLQLLTPATRQKTLPQLRNNTSDGAGEFTVASPLVDSNTLIYWHSTWHLCHLLSHTEHTHAI